MFGGYVQVRVVPVVKDEIATPFSNMISSNFKEGAAKDHTKQKSLLESKIGAHKEDKEPVEIQQTFAET
jgi:hypothetical protein